MKVDKDIFRFPKKFMPILETLTNEDFGLLMKAFIYKNPENLPSHLKPFYDGFIQDVLNIEAKVEQGKKWWRPKKPKVLDEDKNEKPKVIENKNLRLWSEETKVKDKDKEKVKEKEIIDISSKEEASPEKIEEENLKNLDEENIFLKKKEELEKKIKSMETEITNLKTTIENMKNSIGSVNLPPTVTNNASIQGMKMGAAKPQPVPIPGQKIYTLPYVKQKGFVL